MLKDQLENPRFSFPASQIHSLKVSRTQLAAGLGKDPPAQPLGAVISPPKTTISAHFQQRDELETSLKPPTPCCPKIPCFPFGKILEFQSCSAAPVPAVDFSFLGCLSFFFFGGAAENEELIFFPPKSPLDQSSLLHSLKFLWQQK